MKRLFSLILALVLVLGLATTVLADEGTAATKNDSITVNNAKDGETYKLYKMFDLVVNDELTPTAYSYTINADWAAFFNGDGAKYITKNAQGYVTAITDGAGNPVTDSAALAAAAAAYADQAGVPNPVDSEVAAGASVVFDGLADGYYLITSTLGTEAMIETTPANQNVTVDEKNPVDDIVKQVKEDSKAGQDDEYGSANDAQIGDLVEFKSTITLYPNTRNVQVHDTMDAGLTYTAGSVEIAGLTKGTEYTVNETLTDKTFVITFDNDYIKGLTQSPTTLTLTYTATLNENAVKKDNNGVAIVDQKNVTNITYGDNQSVDSETVTTTHKFSVHKYANGVETTYLAGAEFKLQKGTGENPTVVSLIKLDNNNYRVAKVGESGAVTTFTTVENGDIVIWGVDADTDYSLFEENAPAGFNKLNTSVPVTVNANNSTIIPVNNNSGTELPSTGARGTVMMIGISAMVVMVAGVFMITRKRMSIYED